MNVPESVEAANRDRAAPTPALDEFLLAYSADDNWWWRVSCGHHQNLFEEAVDRMQAAEILSRSRT